MMLVASNILGLTIMKFMIIFICHLKFYKSHSKESSSKYMLKVNYCLYSFSDFDFTLILLVGVNLDCQ